MSITLIDPEPLSAAEADQRLEKAVYDHERSEKLICFYLHEIQRRGFYVQFGFENIHDYALERFGICRSKTRALLLLAYRLTRLPRLTEALAKGKVGWTKAAKVASAATTETDEDWTEKAVNHSYRDLELLLRDGIKPGGFKLEAYLNAEQAAVWANGLEAIRRLAGEELDTGMALEYIVGEFLSTVEAEARYREQEVERADGDERAAEITEAVASELDPKAEAVLCPDNEDLPSVTACSYTAIHKEVLERDSWQCSYPGCTVRRGLHVHHIEHRSKFGSKGWAQMNDPSNLTVVCWSHHRMLHAELIGLEGSAPDALAWRRPRLMETAVERHQRLEELGDPDATVELSFADSA